EVAGGQPHGDEHDPRDELDTVGDGTRDERDRDCGERELEDHVDVVDVRYAVQAEHVERVGDQLAVSVAGTVAAPAHRPAPQHEDDGGDREGDVRHHHHVQDRLGPRHAAVEQG